VAVQACSRAGEAAVQAYCRAEEAADKEVVDKEVVDKEVGKSEAEAVVLLSCSSTCLARDRSTVVLY
jgi:hypothetical protein